LTNSRPVASSGGRDEALFGVEDSLRGVEVGAGDGVDGRPVDPPQGIRFLDAVSRRSQRDRAAIEHLIDQHVDQRRGMFRGDVDGADLS
jgi:hypothetical protein